MAIMFCNLISCFELSNMAIVNNSEIEQIRTKLLLDVGKNIQRIREEKGLSQFDLITKMIGEFDVSNVSRIESGRNNPTLFTLYRIAEALEISISTLVEIKPVDD